VSASGIKPLLLSEFLSYHKSPVTTDALTATGKQIDALESGSEQSPGFGTLNRNLGRYLVMIQGGDIAPTESARKAYQSECESYGENMAAAGGLAAGTLPDLNKLLSAQKLAPTTYATPAASSAVCTP
jgi:hypothetical protein